MTAQKSLPLGLLALTVGSFGIGTTEFVIMGLLMQVSADLGVTIASAGLLISGYALGVAVGAPVLTLATRKLPRKTVLLALMAIFTLGNLACALAPDYGSLMAARVITSLAHGTFFGVGSIVATGLVAPERKASAIAVMFSGLSLATLLGVPAGAWLGLHYGWRSTFWVVALIGLLAFLVLAVFVPRSAAENGNGSIRQELAGLARPQVVLGLLMTVFGFAGVFAIFTYIQPILTQLTGFSEAAVSPILLVFGGGIFIGNLLGGRLADSGPANVHPRNPGRDGAGAGRDGFCAAFARRHGALRRAAGRDVLCHGGAAADACAAAGPRRGPEPRGQPEHRRLQYRQRAGRLAGRPGREQFLRPGRLELAGRADHCHRHRHRAVQPVARQA
jgi:predicted MFS family arabinose efflux permease